MSHVYFLDESALIHSRGVPPFGISGPYWEKSCLGPHIKYIVTRNPKKKKSHHVLSKFTFFVGLYS